MSHSRCKSGSKQAALKQIASLIAGARPGNARASSSWTLWASDAQITTSTRRSCGPLAQFLRSQREARRANVVICTGGFAVQADGSLWHSDCPTPDTARALRAGRMTETPA